MNIFLYPKCYDKNKQKIPTNHDKNKQKIPTNRFYGHIQN